MKRLVIFDLDGTILNTIKDIGNSTNYALAQLGYPTYDISSYRIRVGNGINKLFQRSLPEGEKYEENILKMRKIFIEHYSVHCTENTFPYKGIPELLRSLDNHNISLAVASNKYQAATTKLVQHYYNEIPFVAILGQQENRKIKPDPTIIREITQIAKVYENEVLYVGDSGVDMQTAINSHITKCAVTWGFRPIDELQNYKPDYIVNKPEEIFKIVTDSN